MTLYASLNGSRLVSATYSAATYGLWVADVSLADPVTLSSPATLTIANLTLVGTVVRQAIFAGATTARIVGGAGGWRKPVGTRAYDNPLGVSASMVLRDVAAEVGERVNVANDSVIGTRFEREAAQAQRTLAQVAGRQWYVDAAGVTQIGARPASKVSGDYLVASYEGGTGRLSIATEDVAGFSPGATFSNALVPGTVTVSSVEVEMSKAGKLRVTVMAA